MTLTVTLTTCSLSVKQLYILIYLFVDSLTDSLQVVKVIVKLWLALNGFFFSRSI